MLIFVVAALLCGGGPTAARADDDDHGTDRTPLTSIGLVTDLDAPPDPDDPGYGGGFDALNYFENLLDTKIAPCREQLEAATAMWIERHQLSMLLEETGPARLLVHAARSGERGFFEVSYRFDEAQKRARVTLYFVGAEGRLLEPSAIAMLLDEYGVEAFQDSLRSAIRCGDK